MKNFEELTKNQTTNNEKTKATRTTLGAWYLIPQNFKKYFEDATVGDYSINGMDFSFTREVRNTGSRNADGTPRKSEFLRFSIDGKADCSITDAYKRLGLNATPEQVLRGAIAAFGISLGKEQEKQVYAVTAAHEAENKREKKKSATKAEETARADRAELVNVFLQHLAATGRVELILAQDTPEFAQAFEAWQAELE